MVFTFAPRTALLSVMHTAGKLFPRQDRSPSIQPVSQRGLVAAVRRESVLNDLAVGRGERVDSGFYISQAMELVRR
jgi:magnesium-protoporphyrin O-methyltransferase